MDKTLICDSCGNPVAVKAKCLCHDCQKRSHDIRFSSYILTAICCAFLSMFGGCWVYHRYNSETIKASVQYYELQKVNTSYTRSDGTTDTDPFKLLLQDYELVPKKKPVEKK